MSRGQFSVSLNNCFNFLKSIRCELVVEERIKFLEVSMKSGKIGTIDRFKNELNENCSKKADIFKKYEEIAEKDSKDWENFDNTSNTFKGPNRT